MAATEQHPTPEETRTRLLDAAIDVFLEKGYSGTRVQDIASRAGMTTGAIYANFENKAALLARAIGAQGSAAFDSLLVGMDGSVRPDEAVAKAALGLLSGPSRPFHALLLEAWAATRRDADAAESIRPRLDQLQSDVMEAVVRTRAQRGTGEADPTRPSDEAVAFLAVTITLGAVVAKALDLPRPDQAEVEALVGRLVDALA